MNTINQTNTTFGATLVPYTVIPVKTVFNKINRYLEPVAFKNAEECAKLIKHGQAGVVLKKSGMVILGENKKADLFIYDKLKSIPDVCYLG